MPALPARDLSRPVPDSARTTSPALWASGFAVVLSAIGLGIVAVLHGRGVSIEGLTRDVTSFTGAPVYTGVLSSLGILLWGAAGAVSLFTAFVVVLRGDGGSSRWGFFVATGLFTALLCADDLFLLHDNVLPTALGVSGNHVILFYGAIAVVYGIVYVKPILAGSIPLLIVVILSLGGSVVADFMSASISDRHLIIEDGLKYIGITMWLAYCVSVSASALGPHTPASLERAPE